MPNLQNIYNTGIEKAKKTYPNHDVTDSHTRMLCGITDVLLENLDMLQYHDPNDFWWKLGQRFFDSFSGVFLISSKDVNICEVAEYAARDQKKVELPQEEYINWRGFENNTKSALESEKQRLQNEYQNGYIKEYQQRNINFKKLCIFKLDCLRTFGLHNHEGFIHLTNIYDKICKRIVGINEYYFQRIADINQEIAELPAKNRAELRDISDIRAYNKTWKGNDVIPEKDFISDGSIAFSKRLKLKLNESENERVDANRVEELFKTRGELAIILGYREISGTCADWVYLQSANYKKIVRADQLKFAMKKAGSDIFVEISNQVCYIIKIGKHTSEDYVVAMVAVSDKDWDI